MTVLAATFPLRSRDLASATKATPVASSREPVLDRAASYRSIPEGDTSPKATCKVGTTRLRQSDKYGARRVIARSNDAAMYNMPPMLRARSSRSCTNVKRGDVKWQIDRDFILPMTLRCGTASHREGCSFKLV